MKLNFRGITALVLAAFISMQPLAAVAAAPGSYEDSREAPSEADPIDIEEDETEEPEEGEPASEEKGENTGEEEDEQPEEIEKEDETEEDAAPAEDETEEGEEPLEEDTQENTEDTTEEEAQEEMAEEPLEMLPEMLDILLLDELMQEPLGVITDFDQLKAAFADALADDGETVLEISGTITMTERLTIQKGQNIVIRNAGSEAAAQLLLGEDNSLGLFLVETDGKLTIEEIGEDMLIMDGGGRGVNPKSAVFVTCYGALEIHGGTFTGIYQQLANSGAIIGVGDQAQILMTGGTITGNEFTNQYTGAVGIWQGAEFAMEGGVIAGNQCTTSNTAGGVWVYAFAPADKDDKGNYIDKENPSGKITRFTMNGGLIEGNEGYFGGIGAYSRDQSLVNNNGRTEVIINQGTITGNEAAYLGGGIGIYGNAVLTMNGGTVSGNRAPVGGGIGAVNGYTDRLHAYWEQHTFKWAVEDDVKIWPAALTIKAGCITGNEAYYKENFNGPANATGGGIYAASYAVELGENCVIEHNTAVDGAGIYLPPFTKAEIAATVTDNTASGSAGGIHSGGLLTLAGALIEGNTAASGGGLELIYSSGYDTTAIFNVAKAEIKPETRILENTAVNCGGGIYLGKGYTADIEETAIIGNRAGQDGGGIFTEEYDDLSVTKGVFTGNTAQASYSFDMEDDALLRVYKAQIKDTISLSAPFDIASSDAMRNKAYNNYDINYIGIEEEEKTPGGSGGGKKRPERNENLDYENHDAYLIGYPDGTIRPQSNITRAETAVVFFRLLTQEARQANWKQESALHDISADSWYAGLVATLEGMEIVRGHADGSFRPENDITRAEFAAVAARFASETNGETIRFTDTAGHWAQDEIETAAQAGWVTGYPDGSFRPDNYITRAEVAALVNRILERNPAAEEDLHADMISWPDNADTSAWYYFDMQEASNSHDYHLNDEGGERWSGINEIPNWKAFEQ